MAPGRNGAKRQMRRREFVTLLGGAAASWPLNVRAQQAGKVHRIGVFASDNPIMGPAYKALLDELRLLGFVEGQNLIVEQRTTRQTPAALAGSVAEMVRAKVDLIFAGIQPALQAAVGTGIPIIVAAINFDPIAHGYVKSLSQPGADFRSSRPTSLSSWSI